MYKITLRNNRGHHGTFAEVWGKENAKAQYKRALAATKGWNVTLMRGETVIDRSWT